MDISPGGQPNIADAIPSNTHNRYVAPIRLDALQFPDAPRAGTTNIPPTLGNLEFLLDNAGIEPRYDRTKKRAELLKASGGKATMTEIVSLCALHGLPASLAKGYVDEIAHRRSFNPVADWIVSKPWDGVDRLPAFYATITEREGYPPFLKNSILYCWALSAVAAAFRGSGFFARGVLTLQGAQGIGKTSWIRKLAPPPHSEEWVRTGHHLDGGNKDSVLTALGHWIVELGELHSSFRTNMGLIKALISNTSDKIRRPYAAFESEYPRSTIFAATVNREDFLTDPTGNSRWWTIPVVKLDYQHTIDMQQLFAQLKIDYDAGKSWWLGPDDERFLERLNLGHREASVVRERVLALIDNNPDSRLPKRPLSATDMLRIAGLPANNGACRECGAVLREMLGQPRKSNGVIVWDVPLWPGVTVGRAAAETEDVF